MLKFFTGIFILLTMSQLILSGCSSSNCDKSFSFYQEQSPNPRPAIMKIVTVDVRYLDGLPISGVIVESDNPLVALVGAATDANGNYVFNIDVPDGTEFTLTFRKPGHIISSFYVVIGQDGVQEGNIIYYPVTAFGYVPLDSGDTAGRTGDFFYENIGVYNRPVDMVVSSDGKNMYVADRYNHRIRVVDMNTGFISTLAGGAISGYREDSGVAAMFREPRGLALTNDGETLYVSDCFNHCIRKIDMATAQVSLVAGTPGMSGNIIGPNLDAKFSYPGKIALSTDESSLYVADSQNTGIKKIDLVGSVGVTNLVTGFGNSVYGLCIGNDGTKDILYVAASFEHRIYSVDTATGVRTVIAGAGIAGSRDGAGTAALFNAPEGIDIADDNRYLYVSETGSSMIRKIDLLNNNTVSTLSSSPAGYADGASPRFLNPFGLRLFDNDTKLLIADTANNRIREMDASSGYTRNFSGGGRAGFVDGPGGNSSFAFNGFVYGVALTMDLKTMYVSDIKSIWKVNLDTREAVEIAASCSVGTVPTQNIFYGLSNRGISHKIVLSQDEKTIYIADSTSNMIRAVDIATGTSTVIAGSTVAGDEDETTGADSKFKMPSGLALSPLGDELYVADSNNHRIRRVVIATGATTTVAGSSSGFLDAVGTGAKFNLPTDVAISPNGSFLYVADSYNYRVRKIDLTDGNRVSTIAGNSSRGRQDGIGTAAVFDEPRGLTVTPDGKLLFVTDCNGACLRKIDLSTLEVTTYAGGVASGYADGTGDEVLFYNPDAITVSNDSSQLFIADYMNSMIRRVIAAYIDTFQ